MTVTRKILIPTIALFMLVLALLIGLIIAYATNSLETQESSNLDLLRQTFNNSTEAQKQLALSLATQLAENPEVQAAFAAGDRQRLIDLTYPAYQILADQYGVSQAQFHLPPAVSFLRLAPRSCGCTSSIGLAMICPVFASPCWPPMRSSDPLPGWKSGAAALACAAWCP